MKERVDIRNLIKDKMELIKKLNDEIDMLIIEDYKLCDDEQHYKEEEEEFIISKRPKKIEKHLIGRIYWTENIKCYSSNENDFELVPIERSRMVRKDNIWVIRKNNYEN